MNVDNPSTNTANVLSVCTGMYGLDLGFDIAAERCLGRPVRTVCGVEREAYCAEVLATRMEEECLAPFPVWSNLKTFDGRPWRGVVDWVVGGYPCQPFSQAGKRKGVDDERHLWPDIARVIGELGGVEGIEGCFFENVRGHITLGLDTVTGELRGMGFEVAAGLFSAEEVGASHRRERVFILAIRPGLLADAADDARFDHAGQWRSEQGTSHVRGRGEEMADDQPSESRDGESSEQEEKGLWRRGFADESKPLADDPSGGCRELRQSPGGDGLPQRGDETLADDGCERSQGHRETGPETGTVGRGGRAEVSLFAPGPAAFDRWGEVLLRFRPDLAPALPSASEDILAQLEAEPQSELRRVVDGLAPRLERLRGLGNGVVPLEAAHAFAYLIKQHQDGGPLVYHD